MKYAISALVSLIFVGVTFSYFFLYQNFIPNFSTVEKNLSPSGPEPTTYLASGIPCIKANDYENLKTHTHTILKPFVDGEELVVPDIIGRFENCTAEIHTKDFSGAIHIESSREDVRYTMSDLFSVLGEPLYKNGYTLNATVNNISNSEIDKYVFGDDDLVELRYTKISTTSPTVKK